MAFLSLAFRPFFLGAAAHAVVAMFAWGAFLIHGAWSGSMLPDPFLWHGHTMISGVAGAIIAGFLLTASANWTGRATTTPLVLALLLVFWLVGRVGDYVPALPAFAGLVGDGGFWLLTAALVLRVVILAKNWRNIGFAVLPLAFGAVDIAWHLQDAGYAADVARPALWIGVDLLIVIMGAMGGRVIPFFTSRRLPAAKIQSSEALWWTATVFLVAVLIANALFRSGPVAASVMLVAGILVIARLAGWNSAATREEPMLWILHLGYAWIGIGLILRAVAIYTGAFQESTALHAVTVGALGALGLGMISRVALGHTGRALEARDAIVVAFILVNVAALARLASLFAVPVWLAYGLSSLLWVIAFAIYVWIFAPILWRPRAS